MINLIKPRHFRAYTKCPNQCKYSWHIEPSYSKELQFIKAAIKKSYMYFAAYNRPIEWALLRKWASLYLVNKEPQFIASAKKTDLRVMGILSNWYSKFYLDPNYCQPGIINLPILISSLESSFTYYDDLDIITLGNSVIVFDFVEVGPGLVSTYPRRALLNDIFIYVRLWGIKRFTKTTPNSYARIVVGPKTLNIVEIQITHDIMDKAYMLVSTIFKNIRENIFYPAISDHCNKCPYTNKCSM